MMKENIPAALKRYRLAYMSYGSTESNKNKENKEKQEVPHRRILSAFLYAY
jgi:hypothetical protein